MRGAIYCRVSTEDQEQNGMSLPYQKDSCLKFAKDNNLHVIEEYIFMEQYSGGFIDRPQLTKLLLLASKKLIDFVVFTKRDRIARDQYIFQKIIKDLTDNNVKIFYSDEKLTGDYAMDMFMGSTIIGFAAWEREQIKIRTNAGKRQHAKNNKWISSSIPYGYTKSDSKELEIYEDEAKIIRRIFEDYINGKKTIFTIFQTLNKEGIPPPTLSSKNDSKQLGNRKLRKNSSPYWCYSTVRKILSNAVMYSGIYQAFKTQYKKIGDKTIKIGERPKEEWIEMKIPSIISSIQAEKSLELNENNRKFSKKRSYRTYLLQGKLFCDCELKHHNFIGYTNNKKNLKNYRCSLCNATKSDELRRCSNHISAYKIDSVIIDTLKEIFLDPKKFLIDYRINEKANSDDGLRYHELIYELQEIDKKLSRAQELFIDGGINKERLSELTTNIENKREYIVNELSKEEKIIRKLAFESSSSKAFLEEIEQLYDFALDFFNNASYEELKEVVDMVVDKVIIPTDKNNPVRILMKMAVGEFEWKYLTDDMNDFREFNLDETKKPLTKRKVEFLNDSSKDHSNEFLFVSYLRNKHNNAISMKTDHQLFQSGERSWKGYT